jgi:hypothetical protein
VKTLLNQDQLRVWWLTGRLIADQSFFFRSAELWSLARSNSTVAPAEANFYWFFAELTPFGVGLLADWLEDYGEGLEIKSVDFAAPPTVAEVVASLRQKYALLTKGKA